MIPPHPGRRGRALLGFAALDTAWGIRLATVDPGSTNFYSWLDKLCPLWWWSAPWFIVAALCLAFAFRNCDRVAFGGAVGIKIFWATMCLSAETFGEVADAWPQAALFATFAWCVWLIAGWPESFERKGVEWTPPLQ
jgi:hypothetical protein